MAVWVVGRFATIFQNIRLCMQVFMINYPSLKKAEKVRITKWISIDATLISARGSFED